MDAFAKQQKQTKKNRKAKVRQAEARRRRAIEKQQGMVGGFNVGTMAGFLRLVQDRRAAVSAPWAKKYGKAA